MLIHNNAVSTLEDRSHRKPVPTPRFQNVPVIVRIVDTTAELKLPHRPMFRPWLDLEVRRSRALIEARHKSDFRIEVFSDIEMSEFYSNKVVVVSSPPTP